MGIALTKNSIDLGIVTTNGDSMLAFYRDVIGLKYQQAMPMSGGREGVMHRMLCGETLIKLVVLPKVPAVAPPDGIGGASGYRYWTMTVSNLAEMVAACAAAGAKIVIANREVRPGVHIAMVEDPDGNWVEFLSVS